MLVDLDEVCDCVTTCCAGLRTEKAITRDLLEASFLRGWKGVKVSLTCLSRQMYTLFGAVSNSYGLCDVDVPRVD